MHELLAANIAPATATHDYFERMAEVHGVPFTRCMNVLWTCEMDSNARCLKLFTNDTTLANAEVVLVRLYGNWRHSTCAEHLLQRKMVFGICRLAIFISTRSRGIIFGKIHAHAHTQWLPRRQFRVALNLESGTRTYRFARATWICSYLS